MRRMEVIEVRLSAAEHADLARVSRRLGLSLSEIARQAMGYPPEKLAREVPLMSERRVLVYPPPRRG